MAETFQARLDLDVVFSKGVSDYLGFCGILGLGVGWSGETNRL